MFLLLIIFFAIVGYIRGFINQVISILFILSVIFFAKPMGDWLKYSSGWAWFARAPELVAWGVSTFVLFLSWMSIRSLIHAIKKSTELSPADRWVGVALGFLKGSLVVLVLGALFQTLPETSRAQFRDFDKDSKRSLVLAMSQNLLKWEGISSFNSLSEVQQRLSPQEIEFDMIDRAEETTGQIIPWKKKN